ncbi:MAG TPA: NUDIX hydrolase [Polyangiaceae bacterium]|nr:NUDIX hydrolase [Polyangiaceae bacterium]
MSIHTSGPVSHIRRKGYAGRVTLVDKVCQLGYCIGYQFARVLWAFLRPTTHGALVVVWKRGSLLLVRNSYVRYFSPPGGYVHGGETARLAAVRELNEETGLEVRAEQLQLCHEETHNWEFRRDHVTMFDVEIGDSTMVTIDHREVVEARFVTPEQALSLNLFPPLRRRIEKYLANRTARAVS